MLVVLLIAGMAIALGFQSLEQWRRANAAISDIGGAIQQATLTEAWFEDSLRSLIPLKDEEFNGAAQALSGIAVQAVLSHQGGATQVEWSTRNDNGMQYLLLKERGKELSLPLPGVNAASFGYLDKEGRLYEEWPPRLGLHDHLPAAIVLKQEMDDGSERLWAADIAGARNPYLNIFEPSADDF